MPRLFVTLAHAALPVAGCYGSCKRLTACQSAIGRHYTGLLFIIEDSALNLLRQSQAWRLQPSGQSLPPSAGPWCSRSTIFGRCGR
jgi:hypothetical protein